MESSLQKRYDGFDILKCLAALSIICIHAPFAGEFGKYVTAVARFGVPVFLMITGYFFSSTINNNREFKQIKKVLFLILGSNILYFVFSLALATTKGTLSEFFKTSFSIKSIFSFLLLNHSPFGGHLWYLCALLYTLLFVALLRKFLKNWERILYIITPILLVADLVLGKYSLIIFGCEPVPIIFIRNFFFVGIPFFTIGLFINRHRELFSIIKKHTVILWILVVFFVLTTCLERYILVSLNLNATRDQYISTTLLPLPSYFLSLIIWRGMKEN